MGFFSMIKETWQEVNDDELMAKTDNKLPIELRPGSVIRAKFRNKETGMVFHHYGIYSGNRNVIHLRRKTKKIEETGNKNILVTERGASFGYNTLVSDMRSLVIMAKNGYPVIFDATHSVQQPGGQGDSSGGQREMVPVLARAAVAAGVSGIFMETHPNPSIAKSDGLNSMPMNQISALLKTLKEIDKITKNNGFIEDSLND